MLRLPKGLVLTVTILTIACSKPSSINKSHAPVPRIEKSTEALEPFPLERRLDIPQRIRHFRDAFEIDRVLPLEVTEEVVIAEITGLLVHQGLVYILDQQQMITVIFDLDGRFVRQMTRRGQGPGESEFPTAIMAWGDGVAIADRGNIKVYSASGTYQYKMAFADINIFANMGAIKVGEKAIIGNFPTTQRETPAHLVADISDAKSPHIIHGFGYRPGLNFLKNGNRNKKMPQWPEKSFLRVDDRIWVSYSYSGKISVFNLEGQHLADLDSKFDNVQSTDFDHVSTYDEAVLEMGKFYTAEHLVHAGPYVIANYRKQKWKSNLFDTNGNLLVHDLNHDQIPLFFSKDSGGDFLAITVPLDQLTWKNALESKFGPDAKHFYDAGYEEAKRDDYNPWIVLYKPKVAS